ncbi:acyltransferase family protein [Sphingomonas sp. I4]
MDWLRVGAFQLLILYHVGMAFVPWDYPVKLVTPGIPWATIPMFLLNPWRLSLLFVVSGYASAALYAKQGSVAGFLRSRLSRLGIPLVFGMAVVAVPQPWVWLVTHFDYGHGFSYFVIHDYYRFQKIDGVAVPTWMHLWFVVYLLVYTVLLGGLLSLPARWRSACLHVAERVLAGPCCSRRVSSGFMPRATSAPVGRKVTPWSATGARMRLTCLHSCSARRCGGRTVCSFRSAAGGRPRPWQPSLGGLCWQAPSWFGRATRLPRDGYGRRSRLPVQSRAGARSSH